MRRLLVLPLLLTLAACGEGGTRVTQVGDCDVVVDISTCTVAGSATICTREVFMAVRKTPESLRKPS